MEIIVVTPDMNELCFNIDKIIEEIARNNCEKAFRKFFDHYYSKLLHLAFSILKNEEVAQDVVLETFERIWEKRIILPQIKSMTKYLFVIVKNKSIDELRKKKELIALESEEPIIIEKILINNPEKVLLDQELSDKISDAVLKLPEKCRLVYKLIKEDGLKYKEVSELLNLSPKTVDNHLSNAMGRIRHEVTAYLNDNRKYVWKIIRSILVILAI